jgi:hypothetical protein
MKLLGRMKLLVKQNQNGPAPDGTLDGNARDIEGAIAFICFHAVVKPTYSSRNWAFAA